MLSFQAIGKFESLVNQIQKNAKDINNRLEMIENTVLFKPPPQKPNNMLPDTKVQGNNAFFHRLKFQTILEHLHSNCANVCLHCLQHTCTFINFKSLLSRNTLITLRKAVHMSLISWPGSTVPLVHC